jgi:hypothetical protein
MSTATNKKKGTFPSTATKSYKESVNLEPDLVNMFTIQGYKLFGKDETTSPYDARTKALYNVLFHLKIVKYDFLYSGLALSNMLNQKWFENRDYLEAATSILTAANFSVMNEKARDQVEPRDATLEEVRYGWMNPRYGGTESTTCSVKCNDLPELPSSDSRLHWFTWKDAAETQLEIGGLIKCVRDRAYAESHPRQNAALNGLLSKAILKQTRHTNLAILADDTIKSGDGHARWAKLVQLNEHSSLIRIILRELSDNLQKLKLKNVNEYDTFGGTFMQLKNRIVYMVDKGNISGVPDLSEFDMNNWKEKFCDKILVSELNAVTMKCKDSASMDLWETFLTIKAHIIDKDLIIRPTNKGRDKSTGKSRSAERGGSGNDEGDSNRAPTGNNGPPDAYHKSVIDAVFNTIGRNTEMSDDMKNQFKKTFKEAREHVKTGKSTGKSSGGKSAKKSRRRKKKPSTGDTAVKKQRTGELDNLPGSDVEDLGDDYSFSATYLDGQEW